MSSECIFWQFSVFPFPTIKEVRRVGKPFYRPTSRLWLSAVVGQAHVVMFLYIAHKHLIRYVSFRLKHLHARGEKNRQTDVVVLTTMGVGRLNKLSCSFE